MQEHHFAIKESEKITCCIARLDKLFISLADYDDKRDMDPQRIKTLLRVLMSSPRTRSECTYWFNQRQLFPLTVDYHFICEALRNADIMMASSNLVYSDVAMNASTGSSNTVPKSVKQQQQIRHTICTHGLSQQIVCVLLCIVHVCNYRTATYVLLPSVIGVRQRDIVR